MSSTLCPNIATEELLSAYHDLKNLLSLRLGNGHDAADVAQSCFERALVYSRRQRVRNPRALLFRTAENLNIDLARRRQVENRALQFEMLCAGHSACSEHIVMLRQCTGRLMARLRSMPQKRRETFLLVRLHGCTYAEAAEKQQISVAAVEKHMSRAQLDCADLLDELPWVN